jgi:undecaprenyl diphosphate synthase
MAAAEGIRLPSPKLTLTLAAGYGGRADITAAARQLAERVQAGTLRADEIDEQAVGAAISLADLPAPDLFIRTGGEHRISNFLLWQLAYTELWFTDVLWPDLDDAVLDAALADFAGRERRFGLVPEQLDRPALEAR